jgi:DNA (cytosine-5)-methyltransferase 1
MSFTYVDLFAGIGGFHGALSALGGKCVMASELDKDASRIYSRNWGLEPLGDITKLANDGIMEVPEHDVLVGGFPCQPFSKSGRQLGMDEARGTLFWNILKIIEVRRPKIVLLENVRNLAGPRHKHEWRVIINSLRALDYRVSEIPFIVSPHRINPNNGGRPQVRERVFIAATYSGKRHELLVEEPGLPSMLQFESGWKPEQWKLSTDLPLEKLSKGKKEGLLLNQQDQLLIDVWEEFVLLIRKNSGKIPGFPIWVDSWKARVTQVEMEKLPEWKASFIKKNKEFYKENRSVLDRWLKKHKNLKDFPESRRKFEWQAQDTDSLYKTIMHFRPSGIRAKKPNYVPALVAITQTSIIGSQLRRLSVRESARLQGFPEWFDFLDQPDRISYKQLGNAVNIGVVYNVMQALVKRDYDLLSKDRQIASAILGASPNPDQLLERYPELIRFPNQENASKQPKLKLIRG